MRAPRILLLTQENHVIHTNAYKRLGAVSFMRKLLLLIATTLCLGGCTSVISSQSLSLVDRGISFTELSNTPERYIGINLLLAGEIVGVRNSIGGGELELVQFATDENGEITDTANSGGRFIASKAEFLNPDVYRTGLLITLVGEVQGEINMPLGDVDYTYPVLVIREIHLWTPKKFRNPPTFHPFINDIYTIKQYIYDIYNKRFRYHY